MNKPTAKEISRKDAEKRTDKQQQPEAPAASPAPATAKRRPKPVALLSFKERVSLRKRHFEVYRGIRKLQRTGENAKRLAELQTTMKKIGHLYNEQKLADPALRDALKTAAK